MVLTLMVCHHILIHVLYFFFSKAVLQCLNLPDGSNITITTEQLYLSRSKNKRYFKMLQFLQDNTLT